MGKKTIEDVNVRGKRVLVRVDFNVPRNKETGEITDDARMRAALPTLQYLIDHGAKVIVMSHLGRPKGKVVEELRLTEVGKHLSELLGKPVRKMDDCIGPDVEAAVAEMKDGDVILLENVRFYPQEEKNDVHFSKELAKLGDIYVNDAFGTAHRAHGSTAGVGVFLPSVTGYLMKKELTALGNALMRPVKPFVAIIGGAKISDKIGVVSYLIGRADTIIIGGGMANTFLAAQGYDMKASLVEPESIEVAKETLEQAKNAGTELLLPVDVTIAAAFDAPETAKAADIDAIDDGWMALDIGPKTIEKYVAKVADAKTVIWNGPMGVFEQDVFAVGTNALAKAVAESDAYSVVGGGDSVAAVKKSGMADKINHISTGGGASLEFMEGRVLPGLAIIEERED
ncbi:MAG: phosphoglycerate kinase [Peptococcaceae bacterium]|jgi:phosphoglycerate kinase|nr:phosphoglycerate kinase [Peptococcaceae bacterium]